MGAPGPLTATFGRRVATAEGAAATLPVTLQPPGETCGGEHCGVARGCVGHGNTWPGGKGRGNARPPSGPHAPGAGGVSAAQPLVAVAEYALVEHRGHLTRSPYVRLFYSEFTGILQGKLRQRVSGGCILIPILGERNMWSAYRATLASIGTVSNTACSQLSIRGRCSHPWVRYGYHHAAVGTSSLCRHCGIHTEVP
jgi:hypothetical protein